VSEHLRVGVDLARVGDVRQGIEAFGSRYLRRVFTEQELASCAPSGAARERGLAARLAAKEAMVKVLRLDDVGLDWREVEVVRRPGGWTELALHGDLARRADASGILHTSVSLTHEDDIAVAVVVATCSGSPGTADRRST
jgi:holo-[acyl-carrier protein] synthase